MIADRGVYTDVAARPRDDITTTGAVTLERVYVGNLTNQVQVGTLEGATGEHQLAVYAIDYTLFLPFVTKE